VREIIMPSLKVLETKKQTMNELMELIKSHEVVAAADLRKVKSFQIQEIRKKLRNKMQIKTVKTSIVKMAAEKLNQEKKNIVEFSSLLTGPFSLIFTNMNPYNLIMLLSKNKVKVPAKEGDVATDDITVPAGNTGLPPGPLISEFNEVGVQTRIEEGSILIAKDTVVANKGETVSGKLAQVLSRLGIKPMEAGLSLMAAYEDGMVMNADELTLDLDQFKGSIIDALKQSMNLAIYSNYLTKETAVPILSKAYSQAYWLAVQAEYPSLETIPDTLRRAYSIASNISSKLPTTEEVSPKEVKPEPKKDEKPEQKKEEQPETKKKDKTLPKKERPEPKREEKAEIKEQEKELLKEKKLDVQKKEKQELKKKEKKSQPKKKEKAKSKKKEKEILKKEE
jgi:large subunit ribosomal protein L10